MKIDKRNMVNALRAKALKEGFVEMRVTPASLSPETGERLKQWVNNGCHGEMLWIENRIEQRTQPRALWEDVRSVLMLGMSYAPGHDPMALADEADHARISVYSQGRDYHDVVKGALKRLAGWLVHTAKEQEPEVKVFVDTAPVMEKALAAQSGLGWQGKHTNLVSSSHGSWLFLGAIYTSLELEPDMAGHDQCGSCTACQDICPTNAFPAPYKLDARRCISYLTIEHKGPIPNELRKDIGNHIYGCDDCLAVCPWNKFAEAASQHKAFRPRAELTAPEISDLLTLDDAAFRKLFSASPIKRIGRNRFIRNVCIAAGNSGNASHKAQLEKLTRDDDQVVCEAADWAIQQLSAA